MPAPSTKTPPHIAILVDTSTEWGRRLVRGVLRYAGRHGPWYTHVTPRGRGDRRFLPPGWRGDGVIARVTDRPLLDRLRGLGVPLVNTSAVDLEDDALPTVCSDLGAAAEMAIEHFLDRGIRHFAYAGPRHLPYVHQQCQAYQQALERRRLTCHLLPAPRRRAGRTRYEARFEVMARWVQGLPHPAGIFSWAIETGLELLQVCREQRISVPHDIAVLGSDEDDLLCQASDPPLSGVLTASEQVGYEAAALLDRLMNGLTQPPPPRFIGPLAVIDRPSTDTLAIDDPDVRAVLEYIDRRATDPIQMEDILQAIPVARRTIERKFQQYLSRSPSEEIRRRRLAKAQSLLARTDMALPEIAVAVGYATYNHLNHLFKKEYGLTPGQYRRRVRLA